MEDLNKNLRRSIIATVATEKDLTADKSPREGTSRGPML